MTEEKKIICVDTSFFSRIRTNKNISERFEEYNNERHLKCIHDKVWEELIVRTEGSGISIDEKQLEFVMVQIVTYDFCTFGFFDEDWKKKTDKEDFRKGLEGDDRFKTIWRDSQLSKIDKIKKLKELLETECPKGNKYMDYVNQDKDSFIKRWNEIISTPGSNNHHITYKKLEKAIYDSLFPEVFLDDSGKIDRIKFSSVEEVHPMFPRIEGDFLIYSHQNQEHIVISPKSSDYYKNVDRLKQDYPFFYGGRLTGVFIDQLKNIEKKKKSSEKIQINFNKNNIALDKNMFPDLKIVIGWLPLIDKFLTCDKNQSILLKSLMPEHAEKIEYVEQNKKLPEAG